MKRATMIGLYGGACCRKSTLAAAIFVEMKRRGLRVELVTEVAKDHVLDGQPERLRDQLWMLAENMRRVERLRERCDYIVSDGPPLLGAAYCIPLDPIYRFTIEAARPEPQDFSFLLRREHGWDQQGRVGDLDFAKRIDDHIAAIFDREGIPHYLAGSMDEKAIASHVTGAA